MNEQTQNLINQTLVGVIENAAQAKEFVLSEAPEILNQLVLYKTVEHGFLTLFGIILITTFFCLINPFIKYCKEANDADYGEEGPYIFKAVISAIIGLASIIAGLILFCENILQFIKVFFAPKIYLIEYAASLVN